MDWECKFCKIEGTFDDVATAGTHHAACCPRRRVSISIMDWECKFCKIEGTFDDVATAGTHHATGCPRRRVSMGRASCKFCSFEGSVDDVTDVGGHHDRGCPRRRGTCKYCGEEFSFEDVLRHGGHHKILQGDPWDSGDGLCCPRAEGARFTCRKPGCKIQLVVMWGRVWATRPDHPICFAGRGPNHSVRHRSGSHDYWCDKVEAGTVDVCSVVSAENSKLRHAYQQNVQRAEACAQAFTEGAERLLLLLPKWGNKALTLGDNGMEVTTQLLPLFSFHSPSSLKQSLSAVECARQSASLALSEVKKLVHNLHVVRFFKTLFCKHKLKGNTGCMDVVLCFLDRGAFVPEPGYGISYTFKEFEARPVSNETVDEALGDLDMGEHHGADQNQLAEVIQEIEHSEPAALRDPELLAIHGEQQWADNILHLQQQTQQPHIIRVEDPHDSSGPFRLESINLLKFKRCPESLHKALANGAALEPCRSVLAEAGLPWLLPSGAKVMVHPWQYTEAMAAVAEKGIDLRPYHVIVSESLDDFVESAISDVPCRDGARVQQRSALAKAPAEQSELHEITSLTGNAGDDVDEGSEPDEPNEHIPPIVQMRTFLCQARRLRHPDSVTQSTTEAHNGGINPRRALPSSP